MSVRRVAWVGLLLFLGGLAAGCGGSSDAAEPTPAPGVVAILSDLGDFDFVAGSLRGAVLTANPGARILSISQQVPAFDIREGAYWLQQSARQFPPRTVFLAVVYPGAGSVDAREIVAVTSDGKLFVGPDNGLLSLALAEDAAPRVFALTRPDLVAPGALAEPPSFEGDLFRILGYAAGRLSAGAAPSQAGPEITDWVRLEISPAVLEGGQLSGEVVHVETFGNLVTNIPTALIAQLGAQRGQLLQITVGERTTTATFAQAFSDVPVGDFLVYLDGGVVKIAINQGPASQALDARAGTPVSIRLAP